MEALGAPRLKNCHNDAIIPVIRHLLVMLGIRQENYPNPEMTAVMCENIRTGHGNLTVKELRLAFEMAVSLKLDFNPHAFQNVSVLYINELLAAYKKWSTQTYHQLRPDGDREQEREDPDYSPRIFERKPIHWHRASINTGYQHFLSGLLSHYAYIPYDWWGALVEDGRIEYDPDAEVKENLRFNQLTSEHKRRLRNSQQMVWLLFEQAKERKYDCIYYTNTQK